MFKHILGRLRPRGNASAPSSRGPQRSIDIRISPGPFGGTSTGTVFFTPFGAARPTMCFPAGTGLAKMWPGPIGTPLSVI